MIKSIKNNDMKKIYSRLITNKYFSIAKDILTLSGDKRFIVSSLAYYLIISLIPLCTLTYYFLNLFHIEENFVLSIVNSFVPNIKQQSTFTIKDLFNSNFNTIISLMFSIYIASKGFLNYFYYLEDKFNLNNNLNFIKTRVYISVLTLLASLCFSIFNALSYYFNITAIHQFKNIKWSINLILDFILFLFLNYFLLKRKIELFDLIPGSIVTSILFNISSFFLNYYLSIYEKKEKYYGLFTNIIIYILFIYLLAYFLALGNQINYLFHKKNCHQFDDNFN